MRLEHDPEREKEWEMAMADFRIHHALTDERLTRVDDEGLERLWHQWRAERGLPLQDEKWELTYAGSESFLYCLEVFMGGRYVGELTFSNPPSPELAALLKPSVDT